jgi:hypothetical protein
MLNKLILPVYLNQRIVFDLLAMLEGGISHVTRIDSAQKNSDSDEQRYGTRFGLGKALSSLLSIEVSGAREKKHGSDEEYRATEERIHTPASLFFRLRERLFEEELVRVIGPECTPKISDLVEFQASLARNPLLHTMDSMISLIRLASAFSDEGPGQKGPAKHQKKGFDKTLEQMSTFRDQLRSGGTSDILAEKVSGDYRALITLETDCLSDPTMADIVDGHFTILGKVIKTVPSAEESISLIRKSALTMMPKKTLEGLFSSLQELSSDQAFNLPPLHQEISGPAFHVLPIAIYA